MAGRGRDEGDGMSPLAVLHPTADMPPIGADAPNGPPPPPPRIRVRRPTDRRQLTSLILMMLAVVCGAALAEAVFFSGLQHTAAQGRAFAAFRGELAVGVVPIGQSDQQGQFLALGTPIAFLEVPAAGIREVVGEGTTSGVLANGPGHSRTTPFPGQAGVSVVMGRRAAFGGPFKGLRDLQPGAIITVTTGQGVSQYQVSGVRRAGDPIPPPLAAGQGRLVLATADGAAFAPSGVVYVDADLTTPTFPSGPRVQSVPDGRERPLGVDGTSLWSLLVWLQVLIVLVLATIWSWSWWGRLQTWVVFVPVLGLAGIEAAGAFLRLLPNLT